MDKNITFNVQTTPMKKLIFCFFLLALSLGSRAQITRQGNQVPKFRLVKSIAQEVLLNRYFGGDTLDGFDFSAAALEAEARNLNVEPELKAYLKMVQTEFIRKKYHIHKSEPTRFISPVTLASSCNNLDFENGDLTGWTLESGYNQSSLAPLVIMSPGDMDTDQNIYTCTDMNLITLMYGNDPLGFPGVRPGGGSYSARLGSYDANTAWGYSVQCDTNKWSPTYANGQKASQTIMVTANNNLLTVSYAIVLNDGGHPSSQQPYFRFTVTNMSGTPLGSCYTYYVAQPPGSPAPGFVNSGYTNSSDGSALYYQNWNTMSIDLSPYLGTSVKVNFEVAGCAQGSHMSWAYIDLACGSLAMASTGGTSNCANIDTLSLPALPGLIYNWAGPGIIGSTTTASIVVNASGTYTATVGTPGPCAATLTQNVQFADSCVWPGDADEDLSANNFDLLPLGLKYGQTGPTRSSVSNNWLAYSCSDWNDTLPGGVNIKYADCNGDGIINRDDTLAIHLNYGQAHVAKGNIDQSPLSSNADIYLVFDKAQYAPGDTVRADVHIGSLLNTQMNYYGSAFTLSYDNTKVNSGSENFYFNNSWIGNINQQTIKMSQLNSGTGTIDASVVRTTHTDTVGYGKIARLEFILKNPQSDGVMYFDFTPAYKVNYQGTLAPLSKGTDSLLIMNNSTFVVATNKINVSVLPNPSLGVFKVFASNELGTLTVYNSLGEVVSKDRTNSNVAEVNLGNQPRGIYFLLVQGKAIKVIKE